MKYPSCNRIVEMGIVDYFVGVEGFSFALKLLLIVCDQENIHFYSLLVLSDTKQ